MRKTCLICNKLYIPKSGRSKTCSEQCRKTKDKLYNRKYLSEWKKDNPDKHSKLTINWRTSEKCRKYQNQYQKKLKKANVKARLKGIWYGMKYRCTNPENKAYKDYGGRGIVIEWNSFEDFYADMGVPYIPGLTLERINNDGNYCRKNCKWIPKGEQALNRRNTKNNKIYA